jgi:hypothetical protein
MYVCMYVGMYVCISTYVGQGKMVRAGQGRQQFNHSYAKGGEGERDVKYEY